MDDDEESTSVLTPVATNVQSTMVGGITGKGWLKGQSGNPQGKPKDVLTDILRRRLELPSKHGNETRAEDLADELLALCEPPTLPAERIRALEYVYNRLGGTPRQSIDLASAEDDPSVMAMRALAAAIRASAAEIAQVQAPDAPTQ